MNVIVTKRKIQYDGFLPVSTLKEACDTVGTIDVLVYNNSNEDSNDKRIYLSKLLDRVRTLIYICNEKDTDRAIKIMVVGSKGRYYDDEFFLESSEELNNLVSALDDITSLVSLGGVDVLEDFFQRYLKEGSSGFNTNYLSIVKSAVSDIITDYNNKNLEIIQLSETATDVFSNTSAVLANMKKEQESMKNRLISMQSKVSDIGKSGLSTFQSQASTFFFPSVNYLKEKNIVRIKEIGNFRYLTSFVMGYRIYLETIKHLRPKLIIVEKVGDIIKEEYNDYNWVTSRNAKSGNTFYNDVVFTNYPIKEVIHRLLDDDKYDTFIVVDRTKSSTSHILHSRGDVRYAISGASKIKPLKLPKKDCFCSINEVEGTMFTIPMFIEYPLDSSARERFYISELKSCYEKLSIGLRRV